MEHNANFEEKEEVVSYAHAYNGKIILLFEMAVTHNLTTFQCQCTNSHVKSGEMGNLMS